MKTTRVLLALMAVLAGTIAAEPAYAWGRGGHGFYGAPFVAGALIGGALIASTYPYYYRPYAPYPYYYPPYYPAPVVVQPQPTVYVEQPQQQFAPAPQTQGSWYYCPASRAYYPYVRDCASGWQQVAPQPQGG